MIQLNVLNPKGVNHAGITTVKVNEESSSFIDLLKQMSGNGDEKKETDGQVLNAVLSLITLPIEQPPLETAPTVTEHPVTDEVAMKLQNKLQSNPDLSSFFGPNSQNTALILEPSEQRAAKQTEALVVSVPLEGEYSIANRKAPLEREHEVAVKTAAMKKDGAQFVTKKAEPSVISDSPNNPQELPEQTDSFDKSLLNMLDEKEQLQMPTFQTANSGTSLIPSPNMMDPIGKGTFEMPVRASHLANDVTKVLSAAIDVQKTNDNLEATFSLKPEHLGKVDVKVSIHEGNVTAQFFASTSLGKEVLETQVHALRAALEQQGFQVDKIDISQQNMNFSGPFSQKGDSHARQGQQESKKRNGQAVYHQEEEFRDYASESISVSQINTTA